MNDLSHVLERAKKDIEDRRFDGPHFPDHPTEIKELRESLSLSQRQFAARIGVSVETVKSWEAGRRKPGSMAKNLAKLVLTGKR